MLQVPADDLLVSLSAQRLVRDLSLLERCLEFRMCDAGIDRGNPQLLVPPGWAAAVGSRRRRLPAVSSPFTTSAALGRHRFSDQLRLQDEQPQQSADHQRRGAGGQGQDPARQPFFGRELLPDLFRVFAQDRFDIHGIEAPPRPLRINARPRLAADERAVGEHILDQGRNMLDRLLLRNEAGPDLAGHFVDRGLDPLRRHTMKVLARFDQSPVRLERDNAVGKLGQRAPQITAKGLPPLQLPRIVLIRPGRGPLQSAHRAIQFLLRQTELFGHRVQQHATLRH